MNIITYIFSLAVLGITLSHSHLNARGVSPSLLKIATGYVIGSEATRQELFSLSSEAFEKKRSDNQWYAQCTAELTDALLSQDKKLTWSLQSLRRLESFNSLPFHRKFFLLGAMTLVLVKNNFLRKFGKYPEYIDDLSPVVSQEKTSEGVLD